jgi:hypothetical protein
MGYLASEVVEALVPSAYLWRAGFVRDIGIGHGRAKAFESRLRGRVAKVSGKIVAAQENAGSRGRPATKKTAGTPESVASSESS